MAIINVMKENNSASAYQAISWHQHGISGTLRSAARSVLWHRKKMAKNGEAKA
jgi:hypothetical protein